MDKFVLCSEMSSISHSRIVVLVNLFSASLPQTRLTCEMSDIILYRV